MNLWEASFLLSSMWVQCEHFTLILLTNPFISRVGGTYYIMPPVRWECVISLILCENGAIYQGFAGWIWSVTSLTEVYRFPLDCVSKMLAISSSRYSETVVHILNMTGVLIVEIKFIYGCSSVHLIYFLKSNVCNYYAFLFSKA